MLRHSLHIKLFIRLVNILVLYCCVTFFSLQLVLRKWCELIPGAEFRCFVKENKLIGDMEKVVMVWIENQNNHNISLSQSLIQNKALNLQFYEGWERWGSCRKKEKKKLKALKGRSWGLREKSHLLNIKYTVKQQVLT